MIVDDASLVYAGCALSVVIRVLQMGMAPDAVIWRWMVVLNAMDGSLCVHADVPLPSKNHFIETIFASN